MAVAGIVLGWISTAFWVVFVAVDMRRSLIIDTHTSSCYGWDWEAPPFLARPSNR